MQDLTRLSYSHARFGAQRKSTKSWLKMAAGLMMALPGAQAFAEKPNYYHPDPVVYTRGLPENSQANPAQAWENAQALRKEVITKDITNTGNEITALKSFQGRYQEAKTDGVKVSLAQSALTQDHFQSTVLGSIFTEVNNRHYDLEKRALNVIDRTVAKDTLDWLAKAAKGDVPLTEDALKAANTELESTKTDFKTRSDELDKAKKHRSFWIRWVYMTGSPLSATNQAGYKEAWDWVATETPKWRSSKETLQRQEARTDALRTLVATPKEKRAEAIKTLQTQWEKKQTDAQKPFLGATDAEWLSIQEDQIASITLRDKLMQTRKNPVQPGALAMTAQEADRVMLDMPVALKSLQDAKASYEGFQKRLNEDPAADLRMKTEDSPNPWPKNFMVGVASEQQTVSWGNLYIDLVFNRLDQTKSLAKATVEASKFGLRFNTTTGVSSLQIPQVSTQTVNGWNIGEQKNRKLLIIVGGHKPDEADWFGPNGDNMYWRLRNTFNLQESDITILRQPTQDAVAKAFDKLKEQGGKGSEVLVVLSGHGGGWSFDEKVKDGDRFRQGGYQGSFAAQIDQYGLGQTTLYEDFIKEQTRKLANFDCGILLNLSCHSGSWIAKNSELALNRFDVNA